MCKNCRRSNICGLWNAVRPAEVKSCSKFWAKEAVQRGVKTHDVKIHPEYFNGVEDGIKRFDIRKNDRDYQVGDYVVLREWNGAEYTGWQTLVEIAYITDYMQQPGYIVFGFTTETIASHVD